MDEGEPALLFQLARMSIGFVESLAEQLDIAAHAFGLHHFHAGRGLRHDNRDRHAKAATVIAEPLAMIAGRGRDHAARLLFIVEMQ